MNKAIEASLNEGLSVEDTPKKPLEDQVRRGETYVIVEHLLGEFESERILARLIESAELDSHAIQDVVVVFGNRREAIRIQLT